MKLNETTIVSGSWDNTLRVWNLTKKFAPEDISVINSDIDAINSGSDDDDY